MPLLNRRHFLALGGGLLGSCLLGGCSSTQLPLTAAAFSDEQLRRMSLLALTTERPEEIDRPAAVEGRLPAELRGTLYRNGPGLFQRGGSRKRCLLDGDGMVQRFHFDGSGVHYRNRFVRTAKFIEEEAAGRYLYPTWSTQAPGGVLANLGAPDIPNQACVTVFIHQGELYAFDEFQPPYRLDPETLSTQGESWLGLEPGSTVFAAHARRDPATGDWAFYGLDLGRRALLHVTELGGSGRPNFHRVLPLPYATYFHDFFLTPRYYVFVLPPVTISPLPLLSGQVSLTGALKWQTGMPSQVWLLERRSQAAPRVFEAPPLWTWHGVNAWEDGDEVMVELVGFDYPDHFLGRDPALFAVMEGRRGNYSYPGTVRRLRLRPARTQAEMEVLAPENHEFPTIHPRFIGRRCRFAHLGCTLSDTAYFTAVCRLDLATGRRQAYDFGPGHYCAEPLFVPRRADDDAVGWLLVNVYIEARRSTVLAILRAEAPEEGPVALVDPHLPLPLGLHGWWQAGT